jgi:hypothetical protein
MKTELHELTLPDEAELARELAELHDLLLVETECAAVHGDLAAADLLPQNETVPDTYLPWSEWADNLAA